MARAKALTIYDLSRLAAVSIATVSRAMNAATRHRVAPETLNRITRLAERHGYTPSLAARQLGGSAVKTLGVLLPQSPGVFFHHYYTQIMAGISDTLLETEYRFKLIMLRCDDRQWDRYDFRLGEAVEGLIVTHWHVFFSRASVFERLRVPSVVINDPEQGVRALCVSGDHRMGGRLAAEHLLAQGHRDLVVLAGPASSSDSRLRIEGFRQAVHASGTGARVIVLEGGEFQEVRARQVAEAFLSTGARVTGIFCCNDEMALGTLAALQAKGVSCPDRCSVIGYDGDPRTAHATPPLTTVRVPLYEIAREGARRLVDHLQSRRPKGRLEGDVRVPVELVERASVAPCS